MHDFIHTFSLAIVLLAAGAFTGCGRQDVPAFEAGQEYTIQFRRDALGAGAANPISPTTDKMNGAYTSIRGTLKRVSAEWVVIESWGKEISIPKAVILLIEQ